MPLVTPESPAAMRARAGRLEAWADEVEARGASLAQSRYFASARALQVRADRLRETALYWAQRAVDAEHAR